VKVQIDQKVAELVVTGSREEWLAARQQGVGASEASALFDDPDTGRCVSPWLTPLQLYERKVAGEPETAEATEQQEFGLVMEPGVAELARRRIKEKFESEVQVEAPPAFSTYRSVMCPRMTASPDRFTIEPRGVGVLELKTTEHWNRKNWLDEHGEAEIPLHYQIQVQQQLAVLGLGFAWLAVLIGQKCVVLPVERNDAFIETLRAKVQAFWKQVENREPPEPKPGDFGAVRALFPRAQQGKAIKLGDEFTKVADRWFQAVEQKKAAEELEDECKSAFALVMGDAEVATLQDGRKFTHKNQRRVTEPHPVIPEVLAFIRSLRDGTFDDRPDLRKQILDESITALELAAQPKVAEFRVLLRPRAK
jgi:putative phage-type endonuclease